MDCINWEGTVSGRAESSTLKECKYYGFVEAMDPVGAATMNEQN